MRGRPFCVVAVILLAVQWFLTGGLGLAKDLAPSGLECYTQDKDHVVLRGQVYRREKKKDYDIYYVSDSQVMPGLIKESKILVYVKQNTAKTVQYENQPAVRPADVKVGNIIRVEGNVTFFEEPANPGNFDQKFYYQKQGIHALVWGEKVEVEEQRCFWVREKLTQLKYAWKQLLTDAMGEKYGGSMSAILLGEKSELDAEVKALYQKSGIGHILAISGLHMSFLGIGLYQLLRKCKAGFTVAGVTEIVVLLLYTCMIGAGVSALRAMIMYAVRMGAEILGRDYDLLTALSLAAVVLISWQPLYLSDTGFQLSFGAILGIAIVEPVLQKCRWIPKLFCPGLAIQLTLLPVMLNAYFEIPPWSILLNLFVIPLMSGVLALGIFGSLLYIVWAPGGNLLFQACKGILWIYEKGCALSMELPFSRLVTGQPPGWAMVFYYVMLAAVCLLAFWGNGRKQAPSPKVEIIVRNAAALLGVCAVAFCFLTAHSHGTSGELKVTMLDVGQGDGLYIRTPAGRHYFVDGGSSDISNLGTYRLEPFLKSQGVDTLDYVFLSHGDSDHISGIQEMLENQELGIHIETLVLPDLQVMDDALWEIAKLAEENKTRVVMIRAGECVKENGNGEEDFTITCLAPGPDYEGGLGNAASMVLSLRYGAFDMLFTGDVEGEGEEALLQSGKLSELDVLKVAHHGSKNSTREPFLQETMPKIALISAGRDNSYGHPHAETIKRLEDAGCQIYNTQKSGAVTVSSDGKTMRIACYKTNEEKK